MLLDQELYAYVWENPYENNCNSYLVSGDRTILIDPGHTRHVPRLLEQMTADGVSPDGIDLLILTHAHPDHLEGAEAFLDKPVKITMAKEEERYLRESGRLLFEMSGGALPKLRIDFFLKEGRLQVGEKIFEILQTPGHSPGSLTIHWPEKKALFTGDAVFYGGVGRTDFPEGNSRSLLESIERLSRLDIEMMLPGHGEPVLGKEKVLQNFEFLRESVCPYL